MSRRQMARAAATVTLIGGLGLVACFATGFMSVVTTHGTSMLPRFRTGDLAIVWAVGNYHVGQVVAYWSPLLRTVVLHRVVAYHGGLYTFKGDNNPFLDPVRLPVKYVRGSLLVHVPHLGRLYDSLRSPLLLVVVGVLLLAAVGAAAPAARRRGTRPPHPQGQAGNGAASVNLGNSTLALVASLLFVSLAVFAWSRPEDRSVREPRAYREQVSFSYSSVVPSSLVYPGGRARSGQPLFLNIVHSLDVRATFRLSTPYRSSAVTGAMAVTVSLVSGDGWAAVLDRAAPVPLRSSQAVAAVRVDLAPVTADITAVVKETGVEAAAPELVVTASVGFRGRVDGRPVSGSYSPSLSFAVNGLELLLRGQQGSTSPSGAAPLTESETGDVYVMVSAPATVRFFGHSLTVDDLRDIGLAGTTVSLLSAALMALWGLHRRRQGEAAQIEARYGPGLVAIRTPPEDGARAVVDVVEMASLAKLAETYSTVILAHQRDGVHSYYVDGGTQSLYRYRPSPSVTHRARAARERAYEPRHRTHRDWPLFPAPPPQQGAVERDEERTVRL